MTKLQDMFTRVRRAQSGSGIGFIGKNKAAVKPRAAALVVEFTTADAAIAESAVKAGADGLLFSWDGEDDSLESLEKVIDAARASGENVVCGLRITGGWDTLERNLRAS